MSDCLNAAKIGEQNFDKHNVREKVDNALAKLDISRDYILKGFRDLADKDDNGMIKTRALEALADISNMYPKTDADFSLRHKKLLAC